MPRKGDSFLKERWEDELDQPEQGWWTRTQRNLDRPENLWHLEMHEDQGPACGRTIAAPLKAGGGR